MERKQFYRSIHPYWALRLDEETPPVVDIDLAVIREVELMVRDPIPDVFEVAGARSRDVHEQEGSLAIGVGRSNHAGVLCAGIALKLSACSASNSEMNVP